MILSSALYLGMFYEISLLKVVKIRTVSKKAKGATWVDQMSKVNGLSVPLSLGGQIA